MTKYIIALFFLSCNLIQGQTIRIDGNFDDWTGIDPIYTDPLNDGQNNGIDFEKVWIHNDQSLIYFRFELNREINIQDNNEVAIYVDYDNNLDTGFKINGIGAELRYFFGERFGIISEGNDSEFINFIPAGLMISPSVSGTEFELAFDRTISEGGVSFAAQDVIQFRIEDNSFSGDEAPDAIDGIEYELNTANIVSAPQVDLSYSQNADFRFLSYNIENDQLFEFNRRDEFERIFQSISPDIIALQEVRDFNSAETRNLIQEFIPSTWFHKKHGFDIVTLSKYPINFSENINGNAAFFIEINNREVLLINCHLPCCDNDNDRQDEVDGIMEYIREARSGETNYLLKEGTPIIIAGDMNFVGDSRQPNTFETGDIFANGSYGPDFEPDWDGTSLKESDGSTTGLYTNFTWINPNGSFFPGKLDWVFYTDSELKVESAYNLWTSSLSNQQLQENNLQRFDVLGASDHLPTVVDFSFGTLSTDNFTDLDIKIYPNPVSDNLFIVSDEEVLSSIKVLNIEGPVVLSSIPLDRSLNYIDVAHLSPGKYYIIFQGKNGRLAKTFVKI